MHLASIRKTVVIPALLAVLASAGMYAALSPAASASPAATAFATLGRQAYPISQAPQKAPAASQNSLAKPPLPRTAPAASAAPAAYVTRPGDTLSRIAARLGGSASRWPLLWYANRRKIPDPNTLRAGMRLLLPTAWGSVPSRVRRLALRAAGALPSSAPSGSGGSGGTPPPPPGSGRYSCSQLESLWVAAGGPASQEVNAASVAIAESGGYPGAQNASGATGLWQILGQVVPGNLFDPMVNAENAVKKYEDAGGWSPWTTWPSAAGIC